MLVHTVQMEQKDRLKQAIQESGYDNPTDAWRANERILKSGRVGKDLLTSMTNGNREISKNAAAVLSRVFGHTPGWYLYGVEDAAAPRQLDIPMVSMVSAGRMRDQPGVTAADVERYVRLADLPPGDWIALGVDGSSMNRIAPEGSIIIVNRADSTLIDGKYYVFALDGGAATFKTYRREPERLQPFSFDPDHMSIPVTPETDMYVFGRVRRIIQEV
ncbi:helix-turn-helix transcriptional regulator [Devosia honganensis]|uniref:Helix-turn-helix transcriptional regulator n=1 Tax=Devosia honganensis TaxID=1610527 RepID=A0ABV7X490_9HYPH